MSDFSTIDEEVRAITEARAAEALRVTAGYTVEELRAMPDQALGKAMRALHQIEEHHVAQNEYKGRDESRSLTLRIVRAALDKVVRND